MLVAFCGNDCGVRATVATTVPIGILIALVLVFLTASTLADAAGSNKQRSAPIDARKLDAGDGDIPKGAHELFSV
jgi:hypothetical protein